MLERILFILSIPIIVFGCYCLWIIHYNYRALWNTNTIEITAATPLSAERVKVEYGVSVNTINRSTDEDLFRNRGKYIVLFDGDVEEDIPNEYGENDFLITYDNNYYLSFRQFKFNQNHQHDYRFHFFKRKNDVHVRVTIEGEDGAKFEHRMLPIRSADKYRCNVPVDSAGVVYNMVELVD